MNVNTFISGKYVCVVAIVMHLHSGIITYLLIKFISSLASEGGCTWQKANNRNEREQNTWPKESSTKVKTHGEWSDEFNKTAIIGTDANRGKLKKKKNYSWCCDYKMTDRF